MHSVGVFCVFVPRAGGKQSVVGGVWRYGRRVRRREREVRMEMEMEMEKEIPRCTTVRTYMLDVDNV